MYEISRDYLIKLVVAQIEFYTSIRGDIEGIFNETVLGTDRIFY